MTPNAWFPRIARRSLVNPTRRTFTAALLALAGLPGDGRTQGVLDEFGEALTWSSAGGERRAKLGGLIDVEGYVLPLPAPGVIDSGSQVLFTPRVSLFLDAQWGRSLYGFVQARIDRGFDPADEAVDGRFDEYALRWTPAPGRRFNVQVGKFATVVGSWTPRHDSWANPFITAPLPYEQLTGIWDNEPPRSATQLLLWSHVRPGFTRDLESETYVRVPVIWGPSYTLGVAAAGEIDRFRYAFEVKSASLSSRPEAWRERDTTWEHPTVSGRVRFVPDERWEFGWSGSAGAFLLPDATPFLAAGYGRGDYRQIVLGQDVSFAWRHLQVWLEVFASRFELPLIGDADSLAYYIETKYKFTARFSGALRWNQQLFGDVIERGVPVRWGRNAWRIDIAPTFRVSAHAQVKVQYSLQRGDHDRHRTSHLLAVQSTLRF